MLSDLMNRADVDSLVCATDAGREGELIFRLVYHQPGAQADGASVDFVNGGGCNQSGIFLSTTQQRI